MNQEAAKKFLLGLPPNDYLAFMKDVHASYPLRTPAMTNEIINRWRNAEKTVKKAMPTQATAAPSSTIDKPGEGISGLGRKPASCIPLPWQKSAWKTGFVFRGDKLPTNGRIYIDVEKVTLKKQFSGSGNTHENKAATVAVVNEDGKLVLWAFIKIDHEKICKYAPMITNLNERKLGIGVDLSMVHVCLQKCIRDTHNVVVGCALKNDFESLNFPIKLNEYCDLQHLLCDEKGGFALGLMAQKMTKTRNDFQADFHSAIDDARMTLTVHRKYMELAKTPGAVQRQVEKLSDGREKYKASKPKYFSEKCRCDL